MFVTWMDNDDGTMTFEVQSIDPDELDESVDTSAHWLSVTFSEDNAHADDTNIMCSTGFEPNTRLYWSVGFLPVYVGNDEGLETIMVSRCQTIIYRRMSCLLENIHTLIG